MTAARQNNTTAAAMVGVASSTAFRSDAAARQSAGGDQRKAQSHAGGRREHDGRQLERTVRRDELGEIVARFRREHETEDHAKLQRIGDRDEQPTDTENQTAGKTAQTDAGIVKHVEPAHRRGSGGVAPANGLEKLCSSDVEGLGSDDLFAESPRRIAQCQGREKHAPKNHECQPHAAIEQDPPRHFVEHLVGPSAPAKDLAAVELIVRTPDQLVEVLHGVRGQLVGVGQSQVGAGTAIRSGKTQDPAQPPSAGCAPVPTGGTWFPVRPSRRDGVRVAVRLSSNGDLRIGHFRRFRSRRKHGLARRVGDERPIVKGAQQQVRIRFRRHRKPLDQRLGERAGDLIAPGRREPLAARDIDTQGGGQPALTTNVKGNCWAKRTTSGCCTGETPFSLLRRSTTTIVPQVRSPSR